MTQKKLEKYKEIIDILNETDKIILENPLNGYAYAYGKLKGFLDHELIKLEIR